jgi:hypothetical protein
VDLADVLWIGGPQGSGKSTVATALARRFDLQLYVVDFRTWAHEPRMPSTEFRSLSLDDRWVHATPAQMLDWFVTISRHRFRLVLEDLRELPDSPAAVVEGPQLFPTSVAAVLRSRDQALFLVPDPAEQRERLLARGPIPGTSDGLRARANATERDVLINRRYTYEARDLQLTVLPVDAPLAEVVERAAEHFQPVIERAPRDVDLASIRRFENDVLATQVRLYRESVGALKPEDATLPFACECGASGCDDEVELSLDEYDALRASGAGSAISRRTSSASAQRRSR